MWKLGLRPRCSFSGNICFEISVFCLCSVVVCGGLASAEKWKLVPAASLPHPPFPLEEGNSYCTFTYILLLSANRTCWMITTSTVQVDLEILFPSKQVFGEV